MASLQKTRLKIRFPDDWHHHLRDGQCLLTTVPLAAKRFRRVIAMPNLKPPVTTVEMAMAYRKRILDALPKSESESEADPFTSFEPLMTLYLTDNTPPSEIDLAVSSGIVKGIKLYPAGATTNSDAGVTDIENVIPTLERMATLGMPLLVHGEVTHRKVTSAESSADTNPFKQPDEPKITDVDVFEREALFVTEVMMPLVKRIPKLRVVMEHITTKEAAEFVSKAGPNIAATITPQHLRFNRNAIFNGGVRPHYYCLPILKHEKHRQALLKAVASGSPKFFIGTDSAPHTQGRKESSCGCAGCFNVHAALSFYADTFAGLNSLENLENFLSVNGPKFYNLPLNEQKIDLFHSSVVNKEDVAIVPDNVPYYYDGQTEEVCVPLGASQPLNWLVKGVDCPADVQEKEESKEVQGQESFEF